MKGQVVAVLVVILLAGALGAYLLLAPSTSGNTTTDHSSSSSSATLQVQGAPAHVTVSNVSCNSSQGTCVVSLVNSGGAVEATGCTMNGSAGVLAPKPASIPAGGLVNVTCAPSSGTSLSIPGYHLNGSIQLGDGSSVEFVGTWQ
jgi:hypothetical protein